MRLLVSIAKAVMFGLRTIRRTLTSLAFAFLLIFTIASHTVEAITNFVGTLVGSVSNVETVASQRKKQVTSFASQIEANEAEIDALKKRETDLRTQNRSLRQKQSVVLNGKSMEPRQAIRATSRKIQARTAKVAVGNIVALNGEAIPFYGIGVAIGATTVELAAACLTMKELRELETAFGLANDEEQRTEAVCGIDPPTMQQVWEGVKSSPRTFFVSARDGVLDTASFVGEEATDAGIWAKEKVLAIKTSISELEAPSLDSVSKQIERLKFWE